MELKKRIENTIRDIPDYPKPGIIFKDITPVLSDPQLMHAIVQEQVKFWKPHNIQAVAGIEARGFIFGSLLAYALECAFVPVRKSGKLPYTTVSRDYSLEYGTASIEMHIDALQPGCRVLIQDDLLATGGTASATGDLVKSVGAELAGFSFLINLGFLPGKKNLQDNFDLDPYYIVEY